MSASKRPYTFGDTARASESRQASVHAGKAQSWHAHRAVAPQQNALDLQLARDILANPNFRPCDSAEGFTAHSAAWLAELPDRQLSRACRHVFQCRLRTLRGGTIVTDTAFDDKRQGKYARETRPTWMQDPALLPKRPPGKASE